MYAVNRVVRLAVEQRRKVYERGPLYLADCFIERSAPHLIKSDGRCAGGSHPGRRVSWIVCVDRADNHLDAIGFSHSSHTLQVVSGIAEVILKKIVACGHDNNGFGWRDSNTR